jgi:hypothetical protein
MPDAIPTLKLVLKKEIVRENTIVKNDDNKVETEKCAVSTCSSPENVIFHKFPEDAKMQSAWSAACDKGQLISECLFDSFKFSKKQQKI